MIYITGDTHIPIDIKKLNTTNFPLQKNMTKEDYLIICGDFGGIWDNSRQDLHWLKWLENKNFVTLFVDGNHENFELLNNEFHVVDFHGGKAHKIRENIYHLMRGEIFDLPTNDNTIEDKVYKIFVMGGAESHDKQYRVVGKTWWAEEVPAEHEYKNAKTNLENSLFNVDFIITHCAPTFVQSKISDDYPRNKLTGFLETVALKVNFKKWYFGHYHTDKKIGINDVKEYVAIYDNVVKLEE